MSQMAPRANQRKGDYSMRKLLTLGLFLLGACAYFPKYVSLVRSTIPKSVMVEVPTTVTQITLTVENKKLVIRTSTVTIPIEGSGVFVSPVGHILTCAHMVSVGEAQSIVVTTSRGLKIPAILLYKDDRRDLALLKVEGTYPYATIADRVQLGEEVLAIGNPLGNDFTVTHGIVSHLDRDIGEGFLFMQTDAGIHHGNSGGPLFNVRGEVVGINARLFADEPGLGCAISIATIREFLRLFQGMR